MSQQGLTQAGVTAALIAGRSAGLFTAGGRPFAEISAADYDAGVWYTTDLQAVTTTAASTLTNGVIAFVPFIPTFTHTFTGMGWYHSSAAQNGQNIRMGIYSSTNRKPSTLLNDFGNVATTAATAFRTATTGTALCQAGKLYWMAINADGALNGHKWTAATIAPTGRTLAMGLIDPGTAIPASDALNIAGFTMASAFGAMPAIGTLVDNASVVQPPPVLFMKG